MNLKPLGDRLIVEVLEEEDRPSAASCFRIPRRKSRSAARSSQSARAPGTTTESTSRWTWTRATRSSSQVRGTEIKVGTDEYLILRESDVLAKVVGTVSGRCNCVVRGGKRNMAHKELKFNEDALAALSSAV